MESEFDATACGYCCGIDNTDLRTFLATIERELGRTLAGWELLAMADGWRQGADDARTHRQDMANGVGVIDYSDVPL